MSKSLDHQSVNQSIGWAEFFPYTPRPAQRIMLDLIQDKIDKGKSIVIEAANGTGKTITAIASVLPFAMRHRKKIIYMARTHNQMDRVIEELIEIRRIKGHNISAVALRGRSSMCINSDAISISQTDTGVNFIDLCNRLKKSHNCKYHFNMIQNIDTVDNCVNQILKQPATAQYIFDITGNFKMCPAEMSKLTLQESSIIACSYLFMFDPLLRDTFMQHMDCSMDDLILIIDEAHNLPDTVINISSDTFFSFMIYVALEENREYGNNEDISSFLRTLLDFSQISIDTIDQETIINQDQFLHEIPIDQAMCKTMRSIGNKVKEAKMKLGNSPKSMLDTIAIFFEKLIYVREDTGYCFSIEKINDRSNNPSITFKIAAIDPARLIGLVNRRVCSSIYLSGSIGDLKLFSWYIGLKKSNTIIKKMPSPYSPKNIKVVVPTNISTLYKSRTPENFQKITEQILQIIDRSPGNTGLFVTSYRMLSELEKCGLFKRSTKKVFAVRPGLSSKDNDKLIEEFKSVDQNTGGVLCGVLGGRSSEGTDFKGKLMETVIILGIPFPPPSPRTDAAIRYMDQKIKGQGRQLVYNVPAINKATQGAGRAVRSLSDRAFIVLMDFRFQERRIRHLLPSWIDENLEVIQKNNQIGKLIDEFFSQLGE
jgi:DNA excision repair protein ERCC-2